MRWSIATAMTVFLAFFGLSLIEAFQYRRWSLALFWLVIALTFFLLGARGRQKTPQHYGHSSDSGR